MFGPNETLKALQDQALHHLQSVDFTTPMQQLDDVLEALIEVPTTQRRSDTDFARQAHAALDLLIYRARKLTRVVHTLTEHVSSGTGVLLPLPAPQPYPTRPEPHRETAVDSCTAA